MTVIIVSIESILHIGNSACQDLSFQGANKTILGKETKQKGTLLRTDRQRNVGKHNVYNVIMYSILTTTI